MQGNRADDPDSCLQYTVNAVSGERQAPPKTEDGTDTEEVDTSLAMVYVRIHTGASLPSSIALKTGESDAAAAEDGPSTSASHPEECSLAAAASTEAQAAGPNEATDQAGLSERQALAGTGAGAGISGGQHRPCSHSSCDCPSTARCKQLGGGLPQCPSKAA